MMRTIINLIICILASGWMNGAAAQGLRFHGNEVDISARSGLTIPSSDMKAKPVKELDVRFSIRVNNPRSSGFIFGLQNRADNSMLNLMLRYDQPRDTVWLSFAREGEREFCSVAFPVSRLTSRLIPIEVALDKERRCGSISMDGQRFPIKDIGLESNDFAPQLNFGLSRHIVETASVTLADLIVSADGRATVIPLNESEGTSVHDAGGKVVGSVLNPQWQIDESYYWRKEAEFHSDTPTGCAFNPLSHRFYSFSRDSLIAFDATDHSFARMSLKGEGQLPTIHGMNFFNRANGKIYPYEIYYNNFSAEIDPKTGEWKQLAFTDDDKAIHHHAHLLSQDRRSVLIFGGYGDRCYYNHLVRFDLYTHRFDTIPLKGDIIPPRFFASMTPTASGDSIYLYGGKGNKEGKQDLGVKYYYDLFLINLRDSTCRQLWRQAPPKKDRVPARTLLLDEKAGYMYAMMYPEYQPHSALQLYRISLSDGAETAVGDTIPIISEEIATNVALHQSAGGDRIYCVIQEFAREGATDTRIYSISAPPVSEAELKVYAEEERDWLRIVLIVGGIILVGGAVVAIMTYMKRRKRSVGCIALDEKTAGDLPTATVDIDPVSPSTEPAMEDRVDEPMPVRINQTKELKRKSIHLPELPMRNRISLFGAFTAIDSTGMDISHLFSPKLKLLFIYILMKTIRKGGVTSADLSAVFWPDKEPSKIKNLRNVTMAKLRKILGEFRDLEIIYENGLFSTVVGEGCYCDIKRFYSLTDRLSKRPSEVKEAVREGQDAEALAIIAQGKFLQGLESPELDRFKSTVEAFALDFTMAVMTEGEADRCWEEVALCCRIALQIDSLSQEALEKGIKANIALDNKGGARRLYDNFILNYRRVYGEDFPHTFTDLLKD